MGNQHKCTSHSCHEWQDEVHQTCSEEAKPAVNERRREKRQRHHQQWSRQRRIRWRTNSSSLSMVLVFLSSTTTLTTLLRPAEAQMEVNNLPSTMPTESPQPTKSPAPTVREPSSVPTESPAPTPVPSFLPTLSMEPTGQTPTSEPSSVPSTGAPSSRPSNSPRPTISDPPSGIPSSFPSPYPTSSPVPSGVPSTSAPTITGVPSSVPSETPSSFPSGPLPTQSSSPSQVPSLHPTEAPTDTLAPSPSPSQSPTMKPSSTFMPSSTPSTSQMPSSSSNPSSTPSQHPSDFPSSEPSEPPPTGIPSIWPTGMPSAHPSQYPTGYPSTYPSASPTTFFTNSSRVIEMTMSGMQNLTNVTERLLWQRITSDFVFSYWTERDGTGITLQKVFTFLQNQKVITPTSRRQLQDGGVVVPTGAPISIFEYEQLISFGISSGAIIPPDDDTTSKHLDEIFTRPFETDSQRYVDMLGHLSDTPEFLRVMTIEVTAANPPDTPSPSPGTRGGRLSNGAIVGIVAAVFLILGGVILVGYHSYQRKKREGEFIVRDHTASPPSSAMSGMGYGYDGNQQPVFNPQSSVLPSSQPGTARTIHSGPMSSFSADGSDVMDPNFHANTFAIGGTTGFGSGHAREFGPDIMTPLPVVGEYAPGGVIPIQEATHAPMAEGLGTVLSEESEDDTHALAPPEEIHEELNGVGVINEMNPHAHGVVGEEHPEDVVGVMPIVDPHMLHSYGTVDSSDRQPSMSAFQLEVYDVEDDM